MRLLDTNILSELVRPTPNAGVVAELNRWTSRQLFASALSRYELRYGASLRRDAAVFWSTLQREILPLVIWLPITQDIAERGGDISAYLRRKGRECGDIDPLLAATALEHNLTLVTRNQRHFEPVPGLSIENWFDGS